MQNTVDMFLVIYNVPYEDKYTAHIVVRVTDIPLAAGSRAETPFSDAAGHFTQSVEIERNKLSKLVGERDCMDASPTQVTY